jgi:hypothetical protein
VRIDLIIAPDCVFVDNNRSAWMHRPISGDRKSSPLSCTTRSPTSAAAATWITVVAVTSFWRAARIAL